MQTTMRDLGTERVRRLRSRAIARVHEDRPPADAECRLAAARSWLGSAAEPSHIVRRGVLAGDILRGLTPAIDADELVVGKYAHRPLSPDEQAELDVWNRTGEPALGRALGQRAHMAIDYPRLLRLGTTGVRALIGGRRARLDITQAADLERDDFYRGCLAALDGMEALADRYAEHAVGLAARETDPARAAELREIGRVCGAVPRGPARSFREAVQSVHFATFCMCAGNRMLLFQLGRPDRYLLATYRRDILEGRITPEEAQELIDCLGILLNEYTPRGLAVGWMAGGRDEGGADVSNEITTMLVRAAGHIRMAYPGVGLCWTSETPPEVTETACDLLAQGCSHPALFSDDVITAGLVELGLSHRDACEYIHSTCVEITPVAISNVYVASPYYNLLQCLHDVLGVPATDGSAQEPVAVDSFEDLFAAWQERVRESVRQGVADQRRAMQSRAHAGGFPLLSCFVNDCLALGKDIDHGGARANWVESSFVGLANVTDSLAAIRQLVYEERRLDLDRLRDALACDFEGCADIRALVSRAPRYGNDDEAADALAARIAAFLAEECTRHRTYWDGPVVPGMFCWIMHEQLGRGTAASADGRPAGFPLADGSGPAQGRERCGPTAMVRSVTRWDHAPMIGGVAVNFRFAPDTDRGRLAASIRSVLETYLRLGGFEAQVNVVSPETLRAAQERPAEHRDLVVRIAGYSDYFVSLSPQMQAEVLARTEHAL